MKRWLSAILIAVLLIGCTLGAYAVAEEAAKKVKTTGSVNVRSGPGLSYKSLGAVKKGVTLEYQGEKKKDDRGVVWYRVKYNGSTKAWVSSKYSKLTGSSSSSGSSEGGSSSGGSSSASDAGYGFVKAKADINIRKGPGTDYKAIGSVKDGKKLTYRGESYKDARGVTWYCVSYNGNKGWVSGKYASLTKGAKTVKTSSASAAEKESASKATPKPKATATPAPTRLASYGTASIAQSLNVRTGPGLDFESIGTVSGGKTLTYLGDSCTDERGVTWYRVIYEGRSDAWVSSMYASLSANSETVSRGTSVFSEGSVEATANVNLRIGPGAHNEKAGAMKKGQKLRYMGAYSSDDSGLEWYMVRTGDGKNVWVCADYARLMGASEPLEPTPEPISVWADDTEDTAGDDTGFDWFTDADVFVGDESTAGEGTDALELTGEDTAEAFSPWDAEDVPAAVTPWVAENLPAMPRMESAAAITGAYSREQIVSALGLYSNDQFLNTTGVSESYENGQTVLKIGLKDGVFLGSTEGYDKYWMELDGVISAFDADLDGDGAQEFVALYARSFAGTTQWNLAVFEPQEGGFTFAAEIQPDIREKNERFVRLTALEKGMGIFVGNVDYLDGAAAVISGVVYGYSGGRILGEAMFSATNVSYSYAVYGKAFTPDAVSTIDAACQGYPYDPATAAGLGIVEGENFTSFDLGGYKPIMDPVTGMLHPENFAGIEMVGTALAAYGVETGYEIFPGDDGAEAYTVILAGGDVILSIDEGYEADGVTAFVEMRIGTFAA